MIFLAKRQLMVPTVAAISTNVQSLANPAALLAVWILCGTRALAEPSVVYDEPAVTSADREHWAFRPVARSVLPAVQTDRQAAGPIDRFVISKLEENGLSPAPAADRQTFIRRLSFDLTGLPPNADEIEALVASDAPDARARLVDQLLASPHYGQRWAQYWLDLARFAETDGFEHDKVRAQAWRYRDWVIDALNSDLPYDRFLVSQLAAGGAPEKPDEGTTNVAGAFCLSGPDMPDINSQDERRHNLLNEMASTVGSVFLGLQIGCAQCHDHKYDPISQADFYRLRAIFEPAVAVKKNESVFLLQDVTKYDRPSHIMVRGDWRRPGTKIQPGFPRIANPWNAEIDSTVSTAPSRARRSALAQWLVRRDHPLTARVIVNRIWHHHFGAGLSRTPSDFGTLGDAPSHPRLLDWLATELIDFGWSLKRLHRVIVLSSTYGQASRLPTADGLHPLTMVEVHSQWRKASELDPENRLVHRYSRRRLDAESIRDAMLHVSGMLSSRTGGPGVMPPLPQELVGTLLKNQWKVSPNREDHFRRSVYLFARRNLRFPILDAFDRPDANASCAKRNRSTTATQSLLLLNSEASIQAANHLASLISSSRVNGEEAHVRLAFRRVFGRDPAPAELTESVSFLHGQARLAERETRDSHGQHSGENPSRVALRDFCLALFNCSEFIYID